MSIEQSRPLFEKSTDMSRRDSEISQIEQPSEKIEKIKAITQEIERVYELSTNLESIHRDAIRGLLAAIGTLLREEAFILDTVSSPENTSYSIDIATRELLKQSLSELGLELKV